MEQRRVRKIRSEVNRLETDARAAKGPSVLLSPTEREQLEKVVARISALQQRLKKLDP